MISKEVFDLIDRFERSSIHTLKLSTGDFTMELSRGAVTAAAAPAVEPGAPAPAPAAQDAAIAAPLVGTYYAASAPDAAPFVRVGDRMEKGQTVCLIEAMKMMNEVCAPCDLVITEVLKENGSVAAFDEALFRYRPC